jgi:hypothetical protein
MPTFATTLSCDALAVLARAQAGIWDTKKWGGTTSEDFLKVSAIMSPSSSLHSLIVCHIHGGQHPTSGWVSPAASDAKLNMSRYDKAGMAKALAVHGPVAYTPCSHHRSPSLRPISIAGRLSVEAIPEGSGVENNLVRCDSDLKVETTGMWRSAGTKGGRAALSAPRHW